MRYLLAFLLLSSPALAAEPEWARGSELGSAELSLVSRGKPIPRKKKKPARDCVPAGGSCWGGFAGAECCSQMCSWSIPIYYGYCY